MWFASRRNSMEQSVTPTPAVSPPRKQGTSSPPTRRKFLGLSGWGALGLFWSNWLRAEAAKRSGVVSDLATRPGKARSVILIFNAGAPSHIDLWDMKPEAPTTVRGQFQPITTNV